VATADSAVQTCVDESASFTATRKAERIRRSGRWRPNLYSAIVTSNQRQGARCGAGELWRALPSFDADKGFFLNGKSVKIKGTCNHQDHAGVGAAVPDRLQWFRLAVLKEMGGNAVRTSHNMPTPEWVEACDRMGMMMMCETRQMSSNPEGWRSWKRW
jgi:beta-galactosidase